MNRIAIYFAKLFGSHTADNAVSALTAAVSRLESVVDHQLHISEAKATAIADLTAAKAFAEAEARKARALAGKLKALFS